MRNTQYIRVGDILCPVRLYAGRASYIPFQYRKTGSKHDGSELSEDKQYHCSYHVYEPFVYRHYRRTRKDTVLVQGGTLWEFVNIILDPLFIFYFGLGVEGAAWATAFSQWGAMMYAIYLLRHRLELTLSIKAVPRKFLRKILGIGTAPAMQRILFSLIGIAIGRIVSIWGTDAIAAQKLGLQIESLSFLLMNGLMQATSILIGQYYGERNTDMIRKCYRTSIRLGYCISIPATFIFLAFPETILSFFVKEAATIEIGSAYLRIVGFSQLFATLEILTSGAYTGQGLTKYPATVSIVFTTMRIPLALLLGKSMGMGIDGVWWSISLTSVIKGIVLYLLYRKREKELEESNIQYSSI